MVEISEKLRRLAAEPNFAVMTTLLPDGRPASSVMWIDVDDNALIVNTEVHRQKYRNVLRDPRVTLVITERDDPYRYVEARGRVVEIVKGDAARSHIDRLSMKYRGEPYAERIVSERVVLRIALDREVGGNTE